MYKRRLAMRGWEVSRGEDHRCAKMKNEWVVEIVLANDKDRDEEFAKKFGVSVVTIQKIRTRQRWRHVKVEGAA